MRRPNPHVPRALHLMSVARHEQAIPEWLSALAVDPENPYSITNLAICHAELKQYVLAEQTVAKAIAMDPNGATHQHIYAYILVCQGKNKQSEVVALQALRSHPNDPALLTDLAVSLFRQGQWSEAKKFAESALGFDPEYSRALKIRAESMAYALEKGAVKASLESLAATPECSVAHLIHANALLREGQVREAADAYVEVLKLDPHSKGARTGLKESLRATFLPYRWLLACSFASKKHVKSSSVLILGGIYAAGLAQHELGKEPAWLSLVALPLLVVMLGAFVVWIFYFPFSNVVLRFHPKAKYLLTGWEKAQSGYFLFLLLTSSATIYAYTIDKRWGDAMFFSSFGFILIGLLSYSTVSDRSKLILMHGLGVLFGGFTLLNILNVCVHWSRLH